MLVETLTSYAIKQV